MYDALLDDMEDDSTARAEETIEFDEDSAGVFDADTELDGDVEEVDEEADADAVSGTEDLLGAVDEADSWSDDPVRMYLTQMGEIPLLTRQQEIRLAKQIEITRAKFRRKVLECDYVM